MKFSSPTLAVIAISVSPFISSFGNQTGVSPVLGPGSDATYRDPFQITAGGRFNDNLSEGTLELLAPIISNQENMIGINGRFRFNDDDQQMASVGIVTRFLLEDPGVVLGANAFYDYFSSPNDNSFNQFGFGAEALSKWVDARFNYYLPESKDVVLDSTTSTQTTSSVSGNRRTTVTTTTETLLIETAVEGWNAEIGLLLPYIEEWLAVRTFVGYSSYENPSTNEDDFEGFKARIEVRPVDAVILDVIYHEDDRLMGSNWTFGARVSVPIAVGSGDVFSGVGESFRSSSASLRARMTENVLRSPATLVVSAAQTRTTTTSTTQTIPNNTRTVRSATSQPVSQPAPEDPARSKNVAGTPPPPPADDEEDEGVDNGQYQPPPPTEFLPEPPEGGFPSFDD